MYSPEDENKLHIAVVVSAHGFGHAARASAVMERLRVQQRNLHFDIFSEVPEWFFAETLHKGFTYYTYPTDVGVVQESPFHENLDATYQRANDTFLTENRLAEQLAEKFQAVACQFTLCDISPIGILAADKAGIPSVLVENFTWDWIYEGYIRDEPRLEAVITPLKSIFASASFRIQTEPICAPCRCDLVAKPVARQRRLSSQRVREQLGVSPDQTLVLITAGGIEQKYAAIERLGSLNGQVHFVIPGGVSRWIRKGNLSLLPHHSDFYHPDLVFACNVVVGKLGYSTIAEAYHAGVPFAYAPRERFRETIPLASFVDNNLGGFDIPFVDFVDGSWVNDLPELLRFPRQNRSMPNGADEIARFILEEARLLD